MKYTLNQLRDFSTLFNRSEVNHWFNEDFKSIRLKIKRYDLERKFHGKSYLNILKNTYKVLEEYYPNEYIIKNELLNKWLKNDIKKNDSKIYSELKLGKAIADLAVFNGNSKVFEIKTVLDKEYRLSNQIAEYKKLFNEIYIIVPDVQISKYMDMDKSIGIIAHSLKNKDFSLIRASEMNDFIDVDVLMQVLHTKEYIQIVKEYYCELPDMNSFNQFDICKNLISKIPNDILNHYFVEIMKIRNKNNIFYHKRYIELNQVCLSLNLNQNDADKLIYFLTMNRY